ncbi:MAG TPA: FecR domain-containing protein [Vineibacter sp.]|nr:FecR domain-containing protein [Vineibacter sp.]
MSDTPDHAALAREARAWVVRLTSGAATQADADALAAWRRRSPAHDAAFRAAALLWKRTGAAAALTTTAGMPQTRCYGRRAVMAGAALAAGAATVVVAGAGLGYLPTVNGWLADHHTATGERKQVTLPDGSVATLNTRTSLSVSYTPEQRRIALVEGEASFAVARDARPFVVGAGAGTTTATGTLFAVRCRGETIRVICEEGTVAVSAGSNVRLTAGGAVTYDGNGLRAGTRIDVAAENAWRGGMLMFRDRPLGYVVDEINRYRRGRIWIDSDAAAQRKVTGVFHLDRLDEALAHIERSLGLQATYLPAGMVILR